MPNDKKVPTFLMRDSGSQLRLYGAAIHRRALVSENKVLAHPASVDSIPSSLGQEDHVSMGATSATKLLEIVKNTETVVAIELMSAAQALDFIHPLLAGKGVEAAHREIRKKISFAVSGPHFCSRHRAALALVRSRDLIRAAEEASGRSTESDHRMATSDIIRLRTARSFRAKAGTRKRRCVV